MQMYVTHIETYILASSESAPDVEMWGCGRQENPCGVYRVVYCGRGQCCSLLGFVADSCTQTCFPFLLGSMPSESAIQE